MYHHSVFASPIGDLLIFATGTQLTSVMFASTNYAFSAGAENHLGKNHLIQALEEQFQAYFNGKNPTFNLPLSSEGTPHQQAVWNELQKIPYGHTCCYEDLAKAIGKIQAPRAVGNAVGRNPFHIIIPCHRVIRKNKTLGGFAAGLHVKKALLALEKQ